MKLVSSDNRNSVLVFWVEIQWELKLTNGYSFCILKKICCSFYVHFWSEWDYKCICLLNPNNDIMNYINTI